MKNQNLNVEELRETRSVNEANELLHTGWRLLEIANNQRNHTYILGARTAADQPALNDATLPPPNDSAEHRPTQ